MRMENSVPNSRLPRYSRASEIIKSSGTMKQASRQEELSGMTLMLLAWRALAFDLRHSGVNCKKQDSKCTPYLRILGNVAYLATDRAELFCSSYCSLCVTMGVLLRGSTVCIMPSVPSLAVHHIRHFTPESSHWRESTNM